MEEEIDKQEQIAILNEPPKSLQKSQIQSNASEHMQGYLRIMNYKDLEQYNNHKSQLLSSLSSNYSFHVDGDRSLKIAVIESSKDGEYALLEVQYNRFDFYVWVLNVDEESQSHKIQKKHCGNFSTVYQVKHNHKHVAIKCTAFRNKNFQKIFKATLLQYLVFLMAAQLKCGPAMPKIFAFDLLIFKNCIEFSMEFCGHRLRPGPALTADLTAGLRSLHNINVIHFDIKPENICFSEESNKAVFIDFGLHDVVEEEVGQKSMTKFKGSLFMCSEEMKNVFMEGSGVADLYYNDAFSLRETLNELKSKKRKKKSQDIEELVQTQSYLLIRMKYALLQINSQADPKVYKDSLQKILVKLGSHYHQYLLSFINNLSYSVIIDDIIQDIQKTNPQINAQHLIKAKFRKKIDLSAQLQEESLGQFQTRLRLIKRLNRQDNIEDQVQSIDTEHVSILADQQKARRLQQKVYYRLFAQAQQVNCWKVNEKTKEELMIPFNNICLRVQTFDNMTFAEKQGKCFRHICQYIAVQTKIDKSLYLIIKYSLLSVFLLQFYSSQQLLALITNIMNKQSTSRAKIRVFILILSCTTWLCQYKSLYDQFSFKDIAFFHMNQYLLKMTTQEFSKIQQEAAIVKIILHRSCSKDQKLLRKFPVLFPKINNKITKFYTARQEEEQLSAELYVYALCETIGKPENKSDISFEYFDKLLTLQQYRKEANLCIYDYYEHQIAIVIISSEQYKSAFEKMQIRQFLGNKFIYNYINSPQMHNGNFHYISDNTMYFYQKDLSKMNKHQAFAYRVGVFNHCSLLMFKALNQKQRIDLSSLTSVFSLYEADIILPQLQKIALLESYHNGQTHKYFQLLCHHIKAYFQLQLYGLKLKLQMDIFQKIFAHLRSFMFTLSCAQCKFQCLSTFFITFGSISQNEDLQQLQASLLQYFIWCMKQPNLSKTSIAENIAGLCSFPNTRNIYEVFLTEYIINNQVSPTFFLEMNLSLAEQNTTNLLLFLWQARYVHSEGGMPLYFCFVLYLCRYLENCKYRQASFIVYFAKFICLFLRDIDYEDFISSNIQFLFQNIQRLLSQKYSVFYFSLILYNPYSSCQQQIPLFYYLYICKLCHQLNPTCRNMVKRCFYSSFLANEISRHSIPSRRVFFLMKEQFKIYAEVSSQTIKKLKIREVVKDKLTVIKKIVTKDKRICSQVVNVVKHHIIKYFLKNQRDT